MRTVALLLVAILGAARAYRYKRNVDFPTTTSGYIMTEGEMYASQPDAPSTVAFDGTLSLSLASPEGAVDNAIVAFFDADSMQAIGWPPRALQTDTSSTEICCTQQLFQKGQCGSSVVGEIVVTPLPAGVSPPTVQTTPIVGNSVSLSASSLVHTEQRQYILVGRCAASHVASPATLTGTWTFKNPHGYLPGERYGYLGYNGFLAAAYLAYIVVYGCWLLVQRRHAMLLQLLLLIVAFVGLTETAVLAFTFGSHNVSGEPTCCPVVPSMVAGAVLAALKWTLSHSLLLAVCLGYGVVVPSLPRQQIVGLFVLSALYFAAATISQVVQLTSDDPAAPSIWVVPVAVLNVAFILWIAGALQAVRKRLQREEQAVKLLMYNRLGTALAVSVGFLFIVAVGIALVQAGVLPFPWQYLFLYTQAWDLVYWGVLVAASLIWLPGEATARYAYYAQAAMNDDDDDNEEDDEEEGVRHGNGGVDAPQSSGDGTDVEAVEVELTALDRPGRTTTTATPAGQAGGDEDAAFAIGDESEGDDEPEPSGTNDDAGAAQR